MGVVTGDMVREALTELVRGFVVRSHPRLRLPSVLVTYSVALLGSFWLAYQLRFDFAVPDPQRSALWAQALWIIPLKLAFLLWIGQFTGLLSYFSIPDLRRLALALAGATMAVAGIAFVTTGRWAPPRSVLAGDLVLSLLALSAIRLGFRRAREVCLHTHTGVRPTTRVGIVGAGDAGAALSRELSSKPHLGLKPVVFFDDNTRKWNSRLHGIPVVGAPELLLGTSAPLLDKVIIAMPSASGKRVQEVVRVLQQTGLPFETVPSLSQLASGQVKVSQLRRVEIEDLLGREPVALQTENIRQLIQNQVVLVTGAGGSIGSELCRQIASYGPRRLLLVEQSEWQMFSIEQELIQAGYRELIVPLIGNVLDEVRLREIFALGPPDIVFHAAAHKHVPLMETHPGEAIKNNTFGTMQVATLAQEFGVRAFVLISTDKAINPTSVMGASKRLAELFLQALSGNNLPDAPAATADPVIVPMPGSGTRRRTKFMAVRFGNVLGSSGSVVPIFKQQIAAGGPVTVTHPEVTRYFMTIPEAVGLVLQSATQGQGGEIFVLDMGKPIKIVDLARQLIELSGLRPEVDIEIRFTGLRPGEKLYEELSHDGEHLLATNHPKIMRFVSRPTPFALVQQQLTELAEGLGYHDMAGLKRLLRDCVPEYQPGQGDGHPALRAL